MIEQEFEKFNPQKFVVNVLEGDIQRKSLVEFQEHTKATRLRKSSEQTRLFT